MFLRINKFISFTKVEGPGNRACIWVQGCPIHCKDCAVPWMWSFNEGKNIDIQLLANKILNINDIEGMTFSGGEPFSQAKELYKLGKIIKNHSELSIMTYTGYTLEYIKESNLPEWNDLLSITDLLIDGEYKRDLKTNKPWIGSSNQKYHFLTSRYSHLETTLIEKSNKRVEFQIRPDGRLIINGPINYDDIKDLFKGLILKK